MAKQKFSHEAKTLDLLSTAHHRGEIELSHREEDIKHNTEYTKFALTIAAWPKPDLFNADQTAKRCSDYFNLCAKYNHKPTVTALGLALHLDRVVIADIHLRRRSWARHCSEASAEVIDQAYQMLNALWEDWMTNGQINPASGIFLGKNNFGYRDVTDIQVAQTGDSLESVEKRYQDIPVDVDVRGE